MKKKLVSLALVGAVTLGSVGVADAATSFVKAYLVKSSVSVDGKKVSSNVYQIKNNYYINAKSLKTGNIDSSVSSKKIEIKNKLTDKVKQLQTQVNTLNPKVTDLQKQVNDLKANIEKLTLGDDKQIDLTTGFYTVGLDLPEGTYTIKAKSGSGNLFIHSSSDDLIVNEIMGLDEYDTPVVNNVSLKKGSKIEITSGANLTFIKKY